MSSAQAAHFPNVKPNMTRVDFYVLPDALAQSRLYTTCRLAARAWQQDLWVFIRCQDQPQCLALDELLWHYRPERFLPHDLHSQQPLSPIVLGLEEAPARREGLLINLADNLSPHLAQFSRIIEIVNQHPQQLAIGRENFRQYRRYGYDPKRVEL